MGRIIGESISVKVNTQTDTDSFGMPVYTESWLTIDNVLVCEPSSSDIENALTEYGARIKYTICLPKGDDNDWHDTEVILPNRGVFHTVGDVIEYTEDNLPLDWNRKVHLEQIKG